MSKNATEGRVFANGRVFFGETRPPAQKHGRRPAFANGVVGEGGKNPENIQRNSRNPKSRCIAAAKIPKTYSGIQENSNPAVSPLQKSRKHTAEFKKTQIPLYSRCKKTENIQRNSRNPKSRCILAAKTPKPYSGIQEIPNPAVFPRLFCGILITITLPEGRFPA